MKWRSFGQLTILFSLVSGLVLLLLSMGVDPWLALKVVGAIAALARGLLYGAGDGGSVPPLGEEDDRKTAREIAAGDTDGQSDDEGAS
ncbi:hypothetical protein [Streptomyces collinus]|uniref:hypothetical protein n=1 Tax=Streptomyces collinus TaxID=42684 RepID=UPI002943C319|nr:hypothetical protein [Streptomyces collinus]